ncbi:MAG: AAA family ATPase [Fibrobacter sp.]|jgi:DNA polymerase-3 subunit delta'|nr:AAA family ATPase [Fibrobacter sp.]
MIKYRINGPASQERQRIRLMAALCENRFPQAVVIDGTPGIGKKALAMELSKALQCTDMFERPCGHCFGCKMAADPGAADNWVFPLTAAEAQTKSADEVKAGSRAKTLQDIKQEYIEKIVENPYRTDVFDAGAEISVNLIRTMKSTFAMRGDRTRVVIVAEADRMNDAASNAFLKTLEEVPPDTYFLLTASSRERLLQTIRSRCLAIHLPSLTDAEVKEETLRTLGDDADEDSVSRDVIGLSLGSPGKAFFYLDNAKELCALASDFVVKSIRNDYSGLFEQLSEKDLTEVSEANGFLEVLSFLIADILRKQSGAAVRMPDTMASLDMEAYPRIDADALEMALATVQETMERIASRRSSTMMCLQSLAIKLFEGYK